MAGVVDIGVCTIWFGGNNVRPWRVRCERTGMTYEAEIVECTGFVATNYRDGGFVQLPAGPRGVLNAECARLKNAEEYVG